MADALQNIRLDYHRLCTRVSDALRTQLGDYVQLRRSQREVMRFFNTCSQVCFFSHSLQYLVFSCYNRIDMSFPLMNSATFNTVSSLWFNFLMMSSTYRLTRQMVNSASRHSLLSRVVADQRSGSTLYSLLLIWISPRSQKLGVFCKSVHVLSVDEPSNLDWLNLVPLFSTQ